MIPEPVIALLVQDNLDVACSAIEKAAMERAVTDVDEGFAQSYELRRRHREVCVSVPPTSKWLNRSKSSSGTVKASGIHQYPCQISLALCPSRFVSSRLASVLSRWLFTKTLVIGLSRV